MSETVSFVRLAERAVEYSRACAEIRSLTKSLADFEEDGMPSLRCLTPVIDPSLQTRTSCRKMSYEESQYGDEGRVELQGGWESAREREDWCPACVEVQRIVDARRAAKKRRGHALTAICNIARGIERNIPFAGASR